MIGVMSDSHDNVTMVRKAVALLNPDKLEAEIVPLFLRRG